MIEAIVLGAVQGVAEWLPVSSEAVIILVKNNFFSLSGSLTDDISYALFLHLGTLLSALVFYWKQVRHLLFSLFRFRKQDDETKSFLWFIMIVTLVSGLLGISLLSVVRHYDWVFQNEQVVNFVVAGFLLITALFLYLGERSHRADRQNPTLRDGVVVGLFQGLAIIPGVSRSGSTVAGMGILGFEKLWSLQASFILSIPIVFLANIVMNYHEIGLFSVEKGVAIVVAFVVGYATIAWLVRIAQRIRFSFFVLFFALVVAAFSFFFL